MALHCPCGCKIDGDDETERSRNFKEHPMNGHNQVKAAMQALPGPL